MPGPAVQQLPGGGGLTSYSFRTCPLYFAWIILSYLVPSHFIGILSLGPCILFLFFRGSTPPWHHTGIIYRCTVYGFQTPFHSSWFPNAPLLPVSPGRTTSFGSARSVGVRPVPTPCTPTCEAVTTSRAVAMVTMVIQ